MGDHDFSKTAWRKINLEFLRSVRPALWRGAEFVGGYLEMIGASGGQMFDLLKPVRPKEQFIGVDINAKVITAHRNSGRPFRTICGDVYETALTLSQEKRSVPINVFNFDTTNSAGATWWQGRYRKRDHGEALQALFRNCRQKGLPTVFILNHCIDLGAKLSPPALLREHRDHFLDWARMSWAEPKRRRDLEALTFEETSNFSWTGWAGPFQIYRSEKPSEPTTDTEKAGGVLRMVTLRFYLGSDSRLHLFTQ